MVYSGGIRSFLQIAALCALALSALPSSQAKNVVSKQCIASDGDKSYGVYAIKDESCAKNGGLGCFGKFCRYCKVLDTPKSSHLNTCLSYGVAFTSTTPVAVTQGPCVVSRGDVASGISAVADSGCLNGGLGCFNDHCRFCKVVETTQSAGFMACSSLDSSYNPPLTVTEAPVTAAPIKPVSVAPATDASTKPVAVAPVTDAPTNPVTVAPVTEAPTTVAPATDAPTTATPIAFEPVTKAPTVILDVPKATPTATEPAIPTPDATSEAPVSTTEVPSSTSEVPGDVTEVPTATTATPTTDSPVASIDEPTLTTDAPIVSTDEPASTTGALVISTDGSTLPTEAPVVSADGSTSTTDAPVVSTEVPVSTTEAPFVTETPIDNDLCTLVASAEDIGFGIGVGTDPSCSSGGVGCIDEICRFCKVTTSLQSAPYVDCASLKDGFWSSQAPTADSTNTPTEVPTGTPSATTEVPIATTDATDSPTEIPSETPSATTETPTATVDANTGLPPHTTSETPSATTQVPTSTTETPVATADTPDATSETPTDAPVATSGTPTTDRSAVTEPPTVTEPPISTSETPVIATDGPVVTQEMCGITAAAGDIAVGIYIATDATCSTGGIGCINDLCRFCKVLDTTQSAAFVDCSSIAGFVSDSISPVEIPTIAPGTTTPASCDLAASSGDAVVGIRIITDPTCSAGGVGCIGDVCRFCKVTTSVQSESFIDCTTVDGYKPETEAPATIATTTPVTPSSSVTCTQAASDGDLAAGIDITTDATCSTGGVGCIDSVCRFCQVAATPQSTEFVTCASIAAYSIRTTAPVDVTTPTPSSSSTEVPVTQGDCSLVVSAGDAAVGISITSDATCAVGGVGCIDSVCRFCKVATTVQSAAFVECTSIASFALVSDVSADTATPPTTPTSTDNPAPSTPVVTCSLAVSEGDAAVGIEITADSTCQFGGVGCIDSTCRFCKVKTTEQSAAFIDCPAATVTTTSSTAPVDQTPAPIGVSDVPVDTNVPVDATEAPATATPAETPGADFVTKFPDVTSDASGLSTDNSATSSSTGTDNTATDTPTEAPSVNTGDSSTSDANATTTPTPTEAPVTDVDTSDLLTEAPAGVTTKPPISTIDIDDGGDWEGSDEASDSDSTYFDSEESLDDN